MRTRRGVTLLELLVASIIGFLVAIAAGFAYHSAITTNYSYAAARERVATIERFEKRVTALLRSARLPADDTDPAGYFILNNLTGSDTGGTRLVFSAEAPNLRRDALESDLEFEDMNAEFGPLGGRVEVEIGDAILGDGTNQTGIFLRRQQPADGDPTQGGEQEVLDADVENLQFEFWDGLNWLLEWDTQTIEPKRLPAAVRVRYRRAEEQLDRTFVVRLPASDVTQDNPLSTGAEAQ